MKRGQIFGFDIMIAFSIFLVSIILFYVYMVNASDETSETFELLTYDGKIIADNLMSEGYPANWNSSNVEIIGISNNNKINQTKLEKLYEMIDAGNYDETRNLFNTIYDYYFYFDDNIIINSVEVDGVGNPNVSRNSIESNNLVRVTRMTIYENKTVPIYVLIWE